MAQAPARHAHEGGRFEPQISGLLTLPSEVAATASSRMGLRFLVITVAAALGILLGFVDVLAGAYFFEGSGDVFNHALHPSATAVYIRGLFLLIFVLFGIFASQIIGRLLQSEAEKDAAIARLERAHSEIKTLKGILPICSSCKKIRDDSGEWHRLEKYIHEHSNADFTHGYCPECSGMLKRSRKKKKG